MHIKLWIIILTFFFMYDSYHDHRYFKLLKTYQKYYKMAIICVFGLGLYVMISKGNDMDSVSVLNNFIKIMPIHKDTKDMFTPFIPSSSSHLEHRITTSGGNNKNKRSVSETKKKYVASHQIGNAVIVKNNYLLGLKWIILHDWNTVEPMKLVI